MSRPRGAPIGPPARPAPKDAQAIMARHRDAETIHVGELRAVMATIVVAFRPDIARLDGEVKELRSALAAVSEEQRASFASTWESRLRAWWRHHFQTRRNT